MIRMLWQLLIAALDELFQWPMRTVFIATGNCAVPVLNPFVSQGELRRPLLRHAALQVAITIVYRLYGER
jgi:hypothetical protein